jgi:lipopolysaccharide biosynthesis glycosyltransferase
MFSLSRTRQQVAEAARARNLQLSGDLEQARQLFEKLIYKDVKLADVYVHYADLVTDPQKKIQLYKKALIIDSDHAWALIGTIRTLIDTEKLAEAIGLKTLLIRAVQKKWTKCLTTVTETKKLIKQIEICQKLRVAMDSVSEDNLSLALTRLENLADKIEPEEQTTFICQTAKIFNLFMQRWEQAQETALFLNHLRENKQRVELLVYQLLKNLPEAEVSDTNIKWHIEELLSFILKMNGELEDWSGLYQIGVDFLSFSILPPVYYKLMTLAARKLGLTNTLLKQVVKLNPDTNPQLKNLSQSLIEDMSHTGDISKFHSLIHTDRKYRFPQNKVSHEPVVVFYTTDKGYFSASLASLVSLLWANPGSRYWLKPFLVVDESILEKAVPIVSDLADKLSLDIRVIGSKEILPKELFGTKNRYGFFSGGMSLSNAAYFRIFAAKYFLNQTEYKKALYIDSDTLVSDKIDELFTEDCDFPIYARAEDPHQKIQKTKEINNIKGDYFNSGVLLFNLRHNLTATLLDQCIDLINNPNVNLIFHDQCALNIAFDKNWAPINPKFNYFLPPYEISFPQNQNSKETVILHYYAHPKPWDSLYPDEYSERSRQWFFINNAIDSLLSPRSKELKLNILKESLGLSDSH